MREFKSRFGTVDLDDPKTYDYLPNTEKELDNLMFREIGFAICYMDFFHSRQGIFNKRKKKPRMVEVKPGFSVDFNNTGYEQRQRVYKRIEEFCNNRRDNYHNLMWYKEQIYLFQDEIENMC